MIECVYAEPLPLYLLGFAGPSVYLFDTHVRTGVCVVCVCAHACKLEFMGCELQSFVVIVNDIIILPILTFSLLLPLLVRYHYENLFIHILNLRSNVIL